MRNYAPHYYSNTIPRPRVGTKEIEALIQVERAARRLPQWLGKAIAEGAFNNCVLPDAANADLHNIEKALSYLDNIRAKIS